LCRHAGLTFGALQRVLFNASAISIESARRVPDELLVGQARMNNFPGHRVCQRNVAPHFESQPNIGPLRRTRPPRIDHAQLRAVANPFQYVMEENRVRLARVRAPKQNYVRLFDFAVRTRPAPRPENRRQTDDARGVSSPVATVDVVRADHRAHEFLSHVVQLIGGLRATEHAARARPVFLDLRAEPCSNAVQCLVPSRRTMLTVLPNQRRLSPIFVRAVHGLPLPPFLCFCATYYASSCAQTSISARSTGVARTSRGFHTMLNEFGFLRN